MKIAFDVGGVLSKYPQVFRPLLEVLAESFGVEVYVVSDMHPETKIIDMLTLNDLYRFVDFVRSADYKTHGEMCKAVLCRELGIDLLIDDHMGYLATPGKPLVRLLVMPDPTLPYYATAVEPGDPHWNTDGSEGDFGRRNPPSSKYPPEGRNPGKTFGGTT